MSYRDEVMAYGSDYIRLDRAAEISARADARIAELERECSQWRLELRIYRETENKRIAELEQAVTVRDTEIARLETDLELARRDAGRYRWLRSAPGHSIRWLRWEVRVWSGQFWDSVSSLELDSQIESAMSSEESRAGNGGVV